MVEGDGKVCSRGLRNRTTTKHHSKTLESSRHFSIAGRIIFDWLRKHLQRASGDMKPVYDVKDHDQKLVDGRRIFSELPHVSNPQFPRHNEDNLGSTRSFENLTSQVYKHIDHAAKAPHQNKQHSIYSCNQSAQPSDALHSKSHASQSLHQRPSLAICLQLQQQCLSSHASPKSSLPSSVSSTNMTAMLSATSSR